MVDQRPVDQPLAAIFLYAQAGPQVTGFAGALFHTPVRSVSTA
jgi:hypothetical protein